MKKFLLGLLMAVVPVGAYAQNAPVPNVDPALWVVKDEDTTIYLFGTFHLLDGRRDWFNDEVRAAFDRSDKLVLEAILPDDPSAMQALVMQRAIDPSGTPLSTRLTADQAAKLRGFMGSAGIPMEAVERFRPWFVAMLIAQVSAQRLGLTGEHGPERILSDAAKARGIPIAELEGFEWQMDLFANMSDELGLQQLASTVDRVDELDAMLAPMLDAWSNGDTDALVRLINAGLDDFPELYELLFSRRNATWAQWIEERMARPGTVFMAVGAGHLAGRDSVQDLLAARGIAAQRIAGGRAQ
jgi:uncharacterized protein